MSEAAFESSQSVGAPADIADSDWVVMKFGGTSVSSANNWARIAAILEARLDAGLRPVIVHSALKGVSNALERILEEAAFTDTTAQLEAVRSQHMELAEALGLDGSKLLADMLHELEQLVAGVRLVREVSVRVRVRVMALGELMATTLGAAYLESSGLPVEWMDARDMLTSAGRSGPQRTRDYLSAICDHNADPALAQRLEASGKVVVTQGFIARNQQGETVLLGRSGEMQRGCRTELPADASSWASS